MPTERETNAALELSRTRDLPKIPSPPGTAWREARIRYLPALAFLLVGVGAWHLWQRLPMAGGIRGVGEGTISVMASPVDGFIRHVTVGARDMIERGAPLLLISPVDPRAQMDLVNAQVQLSRLALTPTVSDRNVLDFEQLRVSALRLKSTLAMARANLDRAERVLPRHEKLLQEQLISRDVFDSTVRDRDFYRAEVEETRKALEEIERRMADLQSTPMLGPNTTNSAAAEVITRLEHQLASLSTNWSPVTLTAPLSGEVNMLRQEGEFVRLGETVLTISAARADRVVAYLKQPFPFEPQVGMTLQVCTRGPSPVNFQSRISHVGARVEAITNAVAYLAPGTLVDTGLPVIIPVPDNVTIRPGEVVDVQWNGPVPAAPPAGRPAATP